MYTWLHITVKITDYIHLFCDRTTRFFNRRCYSEITELIATNGAIYDCSLTTYQQSLGNTADEVIYPVAVNVNIQDWTIVSIE